VSKHPQFPQFGIFNAQTAIFMLDLREQIRTYKDNKFPSRNRDRVRQLARETCIELFRNNAFSHENLRNITIDLRFSKRYCVDSYVLAEHQLFPLLSQLKNLSSCELIFHDMDMNKNHSSILRLWKSFFKSLGICNPGECCTCCVLPELRIRIFSPRERELGLPLRLGEWERYPQWMARYDDWYDSGVTGRAYALEHSLAPDIVQPWFEESQEEA
jgi:hypothetical protein